VTAVRPDMRKVLIGTERAQLMSNIPAPVTLAAAPTA
jgi:hypothetical protein